MKNKPDHIFEGRRPDYIIKAMDKVTKEKGEIGVAWMNPNGSLSIRFNRFVVVPTGAEYIITAFIIGDDNDKS